MNECWQNCSSCSDEECPFHEKNYNKEKLIKMFNEKLISESLKNKERTKRK